MMRGRMVLGLLLASTVSAAMWVSGRGGDTADVVESVAETEHAPRLDAARKSGAEERLVVLLDMPARVPMTAAERNPFDTKSWYAAPPPPPPQPSLPPPKPTAPALPFSYVGKMEEGGGRWVVYLAKGEQSFVVGPGETFDNAYRLEGMEGGNLVIQSLPLSSKQLLPIGAPP